MGNKNALKHGYYTRHFTQREISEFELLTERSLVGELVLARTLLGRLAAYVSGEGIGPEEMAAAMPHIVSGLRTIVYLVKNMGDESEAHWDAVLDAVSEELGVAL